ncbi:MAG: nickel pincer cofactor biosynthesis protein LarC [Candidatus Zixiibacteriota bacterium]
MTSRKPRENADVVKRLHFECHSGVSGDMLLGALIDLGATPEELNHSLSLLDLAGLKLTAHSVSKSGVGACRAEVVIDSDRKLTHWREVCLVLEQSALSPFVRDHSLAAMRMIAEAEARIHQSDLESVHFHELGSLDTIADVVGVFTAIESLDPALVTSSPIAVGSGVVQIAHGVLPNPAPATLEILRGLEVDSAPLVGERTTPTGAAILATLLGSLAGQPPPSERVCAVGYGAGTADFGDRVNVLRAILFEGQPSPLLSDTICQMETTIDDMNPQLFSNLFESLYGAGALEAFITAVTMKKTRPGWNLTILCRPEDRRRLSEIVLVDTTSAGLRHQLLGRDIADRETLSVETRHGRVLVKRLTVGERTRFQPEYDSCHKLARQSGVPLREVMDSAREAAEHSFATTGRAREESPAGARCAKRESGV